MTVTYNANEQKQIAKDQNRSIDENRQTKIGKNLSVEIGGAGIAMGITELLTRSDILSPDLDTHSVLFFIFGVPVLFTFGVIVYAMMSYLSEWRKLVASIEKEYGEHKIIFNSKKKSYKKIKEIMAEKSLDTSCEG